VFITASPLKDVLLLQCLKTVESGGIVCGSGDEVHGVLHMRGWFQELSESGTLPFDKILDSSTVLGLSRLQDCLNFIMVIFLTNNFRRGTKVVGTMGSGFFVWRQEGVVEYWVDSPCCW